MAASWDKSLVSSHDISIPGKKKKKAPSSCKEVFFYHICISTPSPSHTRSKRVFLESIRNLFPEDSILFLACSREAAGPTYYLQLNLLAFLNMQLRWAIDWSPSLSNLFSAWGGGGGTDKTQSWKFCSVQTSQEKLIPSKPAMLWWRGHSWQISQSWSKVLRAMKETKIQQHPQSIILFLQEKCDPFQDGWLH